MAQLVERVLGEQITGAPRITVKVVFSPLFSFFLLFSGESNVENES